MNQETVKSKIIRSLIEEKTLTFPQLVEITCENSNSIRGIVVSLLNEGVIDKTKKKRKHTEYFIRELEKLNIKTVESVLNKMSKPIHDFKEYPSCNSDENQPPVATMTQYKRNKELKENKKRIVENFKEIKNRINEIEFLTKRNNELKGGKIKLDIVL